MAADVRSISVESITKLFVDRQGEKGRPVLPSFVRSDPDLDHPVVRESFVMTSTKWIREGRYIVWRANPREISWTMNLRQVDQKTRGGVVSHVWKDRVRGSYFDEPILRFQLQSGNIMPIPTVAQMQAQREAQFDRNVQRNFVNNSRQHQETRDRIAAFKSKAATEQLVTEIRSQRSQRAELTASLNSNHGISAADRALTEASIAGIDAQIAWLEDERDRADIDAGVEADAEVDSAITAAQADQEVLEERLTSEASLTQPLVPPGLYNFYSFLDLVDEQRIISDPNDPNFGRMNLVYVIYNSNIFPQLTLSGIFTPDGVSFADEASEPNMVNSWTANLVVYNTSPRLHSTALVQTFQQLGFRRGL